MHPKAIDAWVAASLLAVVVTLCWRFSSLAFLGWDTYPILAASSQGTTAGIWDALRQPLGAGGLPMTFYRPLLSLSVALEWPLWGLSAGGYVGFNAVLFGACGLLLYSLLLGLRVRRPAALAAMSFFILHPVMPDVVPYLPRRPELLCCFFVLLSLRLDLYGRFAAGRSRWPALLGAGLATAAAAGSKETAVVLPILIAATRALFPAPGLAPWRHALQGFVAHLGVLAAGLPFRLLALGGLGGYPDTDVTQLPKLWLSTLARTGFGVLLPAHASKTLPAVGLAALALGLGWLVFARRREGVERWFGIGPRRMRLLVFAGIWVVTLATIYAAAARLSPWYLLIVAAGVAIGLGAMIDLADSAIRRRRGVWPATAVLFGGTLLLGSFAVHSPMFHTLAGLDVASRDATTFLDSLEERIRQTPPGGRLDVHRYPRLVYGVGNRQVPILEPRSLSAWARLTLPESRIVFRTEDEDRNEPEMDDTTVVVLGHGAHRRAVLPAGSRPQDSSEPP